MTLDMGLSRLITKHHPGMQKPPSIPVGLADLPSAIGIPDEPAHAGLDIPFARSLPDHSAATAAAVHHRRVAWQVPHFQPFFNQSITHSINQSINQLHISSNVLGVSKGFLDFVSP